MNTKKKFKFNITNTYKQMRTGTIETAHGIVRTPAFMPVGTRGTIKAMMPESVQYTSSDIILGNTYHLMLRPGADRIERLGGLRQFMNWSGPILTDSGGFQIMSLSNLCTINEEGVIFRSHIDGSQHILTPELSTKIQHQLDSTITMSFDQCTAYPATFNEAKAAMELTSRWGQRSRDAFIQRDGYAQFGIIQGGIYKELRVMSVQNLVKMNFEGYAIGGLAVGEGQQDMFSVLEYIPSWLPEDKPRYLMGVGKPTDIIGAVKRGIDMFDCVIPTRSGRNGQAFTKNGTINIKNSKFADDPKALEVDCPCPACMNYSKAYLHHTIKSGEIIGAMLMTWHNIQYFQDLMNRIRKCIEQGKELDFNC